MLALTLGLAAALPLPAQAQNADAAFVRLDADGNGAISRTEFLALREAMFLRIDTDASTTLSAAEIEAARQDLPAGRRPPESDRIWTRDTDGDGQLTLAEYRSATPGFDRADRNRDGSLSPAEFSRIAAAAAPLLD
jgi:Ca2+-binding EF-hand superfamily protein